jgi:hypothetical protein
MKINQLMKPILQELFQGEIQLEISFDTAFRTLTIKVWDPSLQRVMVASVMIYVPKTTSGELALKAQKRLVQHFMSFKATVKESFCLHLDETMLSSQ